MNTDRSSALENIFAYNTLIVIGGTMLLGIAAGIVGTFLILRRRALAGDVIGHAALPGVALAFLIYSTMFPDSPKNLAVMLLGGGISSGLGMLAMIWLRKLNRIPEESILAIVLSTFFGFGIVLLSIVQASPTGSQAGLRDFIFGQAASMRQSDVVLLAWIAAATIFTSILLMKEWTLVCFDEGLARVLGYPVMLLDLLLMTLVVAVCVAGMQAVGLLLIVALLVIPASAARFWSDSIRPNVWLAAVFGAASAAGGCVASALVPRLSTGAIIVVVAASLLVVSMLLGTRHGWLGVQHAHRRMRKNQVSNP